MRPSTEGDFLGKILAEHASNPLFSRRSLSMEKVPSNDKALSRHVSTATMEHVFALREKEAAKEAALLEAASPSLSLDEPSAPASARSSARGGGNKTPAPTGARGPPPLRAGGGGGGGGGPSAQAVAAHGDKAAPAPVTAPGKAAGGVTAAGEATADEDFAEGLAAEGLGDLGARLAEAEARASELEAQNASLGGAVSELERALAKSEAERVAAVARHDAQHAELKEVGRGHRKHTEEQIHGFIGIPYMFARRTAVAFT